MTKAVAVGHPAPDFNCTAVVDGRFKGRYTRSKKGIKLEVILTKTQTSP